MRRRFFLAIVWVAGVVVAVALSVSAVGLVGRRVSGRDTTLVSPARVEQALAETTTTTAGGPGPIDDGAAAPAGASAVPPASPAPSPASGATAVPDLAVDALPVLGSADPPTNGAPATPPSPGIEEVYVTTGGTVGVRCTGATITLLYATPASGWGIHGSATTGPTDVDVRFEPAQDAHGAEVHVRVHCEAGVPVEEIREDN